MPYSVAKADITFNDPVTRIQKLGYNNFMLMSEVWRSVVTASAQEISDQATLQNDPNKNLYPIVRISKISDVL